MVDTVLAELDPIFDEMYAMSGRRSVPPETLLKSTVLMAMYSIRSERAFCERLNYDLLFKWFLDMRIDQPAFDATTFTKNLQRLLKPKWLTSSSPRSLRQAKLCRYTSSDHFPSTAPSSTPGRCTSRLRRNTKRCRRHRLAATSTSPGTAISDRTTLTP